MFPALASIRLSDEIQAFYTSTLTEIKKAPNTCLEQYRERLEIMGKDILHYNCYRLQGFCLSALEYFNSTFPNNEISTDPYKTLHLYGQTIKSSRKFDRIVRNNPLIETIYCIGCRWISHCLSSFNTLQLLSSIHLENNEMLKENEFFNISEMKLIGLYKIEISGLFSDNSFTHLRTATFLRVLDCSKTNLENNHLPTFNQLENLTSITLKHTQISDLTQLNMHRFTKINISGCLELSDESFAHLATATHLKILKCSKTKISDRHLPFLNPLQKLNSLDLARCPISDIRRLDVNRLRKLNISGCKNLSGKSYTHLARASTPKLYTIKHNNFPITSTRTALTKVRLHIKCSSCIIKLPASELLLSESDSESDSET
ncbi:MAG: hypothetical protein P4L16_02365 [Chlamydiales bacterium]|nr:hypothetical protein [Chlamydiales bacterium]